MAPRMIPACLLLAGCWGPDFSTEISVLVVNATTEGLPFRITADDLRAEEIRWGDIELLETRSASWTPVTPGQTHFSDESLWEWANLDTTIEIAADTTLVIVTGSVLEGSLAFKQSSDSPSSATALRYFDARSGQDPVSLTDVATDRDGADPAPEGDPIPTIAVDRRTFSEFATLKPDVPRFLLDGDGQAFLGQVFDNGAWTAIRMPGEEADTILIGTDDTFPVVLRPASARLQLFASIAVTEVLLDDEPLLGGLAPDQYTAQPLPVADDSEELTWIDADGVESTLDLIDIDTFPGNSALVVLGDPATDTWTAATTTQAHRCDEIAGLELAAVVVGGATDVQVSWDSLDLPPDGRLLSDTLGSIDARTYLEVTVGSDHATLEFKDGFSSALTGTGSWTVVVEPVGCPGVDCTAELAMVRHCQGGA